MRSALTWRSWLVPPQLPQRRRTCRAEAARRRRKAGMCGSGNLPFRDPLTEARRFIPLRFDDAPINGSLAQFSCVQRMPAVIHSSRWN